MDKKNRAVKKGQQKIRTGDFLLLLLYAYNKTPIKGKTRLQKTAFLFEKEVLKKYRLNNVEFNFEFEPYDYGPFSKKLMDFVDLFKNLNLIEIKSEQIEEESEDEKIFMNDLLQVEDTEWRENFEDAEILGQPIYRITKTGIHYIEKKNIWGSLTEEQKDAIESLKKFCVETSLKIILKYIYTKHSDWAKNSKIKEKILKETEWQF
ncbi:MAG: hypothetical protein ACTSUT_14085 [Promethearchaeota archaeon]